LFTRSATLRDLSSFPTRRSSDLQSTARDFRQAGVDEGTIMELCGWKTPAMFDRYNIVNDADLAAAVAKRFNGTVAAQAEGSPTADRKSTRLNSSHVAISYAVFCL